MPYAYRWWFAASVAMLAACVVLWSEGSETVGFWQGLVVLNLGILTFFSFLIGLEGYIEAGGSRKKVRRRDVPTTNYYKDFLKPELRRRSPRSDRFGRKKKEEAREMGEDVS